MVFISGTLRFVQESRSGNAAEKLLAMITTTCTVIRRGQDTSEIPMDTMVFISGTLRFVQESRSGNAAEKLLAMITTTCTVIRRGQDTSEIPMDELVAGDVVRLSAGDMIPADVRILEAKDFFVSQASLTGESEPIEKVPHTNPQKESVTDYTNADVRILEAKDFFVSQASLTGESEPIEKVPHTNPQKESVTDYTNLAFMGSKGFLCQPGQSYWRK